MKKGNKIDYYFSYANFIKKYFDFVCFSIIERWVCLCIYIAPYLSFFWNIDYKERRLKNESIYIY